MEQDNFESAWNNSGGIAQEIMRLRIKANTHYINNDYSSALKSLVSIKMTIVASLNKDERKELDNLEKKFLVFESFNRMIHPHKKRGEYFRRLQIRLANSFIEFNNKLMIALDNHNLGLGEKENTYQMD